MSNIFGAEMIIGQLIPRQSNPVKVRIMVLWPIIRIGAGFLPAFRPHNQRFVPAWPANIIGAVPANITAVHPPVVLLRLPAEILVPAVRAVRITIVTVIYISPNNLKAPLLDGAFYYETGSI